MTAAERPCARSIERTVRGHANGMRGRHLFWWVRLDLIPDAIPLGRRRADLAGVAACRPAVPADRRRYALAWTDFPYSSREDADASSYPLGNQDPFSDHYAVSAKPSTVHLRTTQIVQIATALVRAGLPAAAITDLAVLYSCRTPSWRCASSSTAPAASRPSIFINMPCC